MTKNLSDMTLEVLWQLFPIVLTEHKTEWVEQYKQMETTLREKLYSCRVARLSHIGSTAINTIWAKPVIDILLEIDPDEDMRIVSDVITGSGFNMMSEADNRISFNYACIVHYNGRRSAEWVYSD